MDIVLKRWEAMVKADVGEEFFAIVSKRWVADIVSQGNGFDQVFIQAQETTDCPCDAGNKLDMKNPVGDMIVGN